MQSLVHLLLVLAAGLHTQVQSAVVGCCHFDPPAPADNSVEGSEVLRNMLTLQSEPGAAPGGESIIVGSSRGLYRLDSSDLKQQDRRSLAEPSHLLAANVSEGAEESVVLHCDNAECALVCLSNLSAPAVWSIKASEALNVEGIENVLVHGIVNGQLLYGERETPISVTTGAQPSKLTKANILLEENVGEMDFFSIIAQHKEKNPFTSLVFLTSFSEGGCTYFAVRSHYDNSYQNRVIRICNSDEGRLQPGVSTRSFTSYYEAELACNVGEGTSEVCLMLQSL